MNTTTRWFRPTIRTVRTLASMLLLTVCAEPTAPPRAEKVVFLTGPSSGTAGTAFDPALRVAIQDASGNVITSINGNVTLALQTNPTSATLLGTTTVMSVNGVATFPDVRIEKAGAGYTLVATSTGLTLATSAAFDVTAGAPASTTLIAGSESAIAGAALETPPGVTVHDAFGNPVGGATVTFAVTAGGGSLSGSTQTTNSEGVATLGGWTLGGTAGVNSITATVTGSSAEPLTISATGTAGPPSQITVNAGDAQTAIAGAAVAVAPSVIVKDANDNPVSGANVTFAVASGDGSATEKSRTTDAAGVATVGSWTLGTVMGANTLTATVGSLDPVTFTATGTAGAVTQIEIADGDAQTAVAGTQVAIKPSVVVKDANGNVVADVSVSFGLPSGGSSIAGGTSRTDASGVATVGSWTLGTTAGAYSLTASAAGLPDSPITFTATAIAGAATQIASAGGDLQAAISGFAVATAPSVVVKDANGNPVSGVSVTFAVAGGGGSVTGAEATTGADGVATVGSWTLGTTAGENTLTATSIGLTGSPVTFTAEGSVGEAAHISVDAGNEQTALAGSTLPIAPAVIVTDAHGNGVPFLKVTFEVTSGGGSITSTKVATNADGRADVGSWTLGGVSGYNELSATAPGLPPITFFAIGLAGPATQFVTASGDGQADTVGKTLPNIVSVIAQDDNGNPVEGVSVTWAVASGDGSLHQSQTETGTDGIATNIWTLGPIAGPQMVTASAAGLSTITFIATASVGAPATLSLVSGDGQTATVGTLVDLVPRVMVVDLYGNPIPGVTITWGNVTGGGSVSDPSVTDSDGEAFGAWLLGTAAGANTMQATVAGLTPVTFTATGVAGPGVQMAIHGGNNQAGTVGAALSTPIAVLVTDTHGNPASGVAVTFSGAGQVSPTDATTDADGVASATWTLPTAPGNFQLDAQNADLAGSPLSFSATAVVGPAAQIWVSGGTSQFATVNTDVAQAPSAMVTDAFGNPLGGIEVTFLVASGGGSLTGPIQTTDENGIATAGSWKLGTTAGEQSVTATFPLYSGEPATFTATAEAGAQASMTLVGGNNQTAAPNSALPVAPTVVLKDAYDNPIKFAFVEFTITSANGGSVNPFFAQTNESGIATIVGWTLGDPGAHTLRVKSALDANIFVDISATAQNP